jgi:hypothetical protein
MPAIISATQLRNVLGVSSALYNDTYLDQVIDSAEDIILPMLVQNSSKVAFVSLSNNVAYYFTVRPHGFTTGQSVVISGRMQMSSFSQAFRKARLIYQAITRRAYTLTRQPLSLPSM